jgi:hypothetical protein
MLLLLLLLFLFLFLSHQVGITGATPEVVAAVLECADSDGDGSVDYEEFMKALLDWVNTEKKLSRRGGGGGRCLE